MYPWISVVQPFGYIKAGGIQIIVTVMSLNGVIELVQATVIEASTASQRA